MNIDIVNCFCTKEANSGNPAAIIHNYIDGRNEKQKLAKKLGMPVTVFLNDTNQSEHHVEFFYPETEMPLCLHGTIGAAYILFQNESGNHLELIAKNDNRLAIRCNKEIVQVRVKECEMPITQINHHAIVDMLNLKNADEKIDDELPFTVSSVGSPKLLVPLVSFELLASLEPNFDLITEWSRETGVNGLYVYTKDVRDHDLDFYARGFNPKTGHHEDAATGVAAAALALSFNRSIVVGQGKFLNRPSEINVSYEDANNIWVGGKVHEVMINDGYIKNEK